MSPFGLSFSDERQKQLQSHQDYESLVVQPRTNRRDTRNWHTLLPWALTTLSWLITTYVLVYNRPSIQPQLPHISHSSTTLCPAITVQSCAEHHPTDLEAMHSIVRYETRRYTGELIYDATTHRFERNLTTNSTLYFGPPSPAIDQAWSDLLQGEFPRLLANESLPYLPELVPIPVDHEYHFEPDVFHSLHCLNAIRTTLDKDYYFDPTKPQVWPQHDWERIHLDHCLDQIRQALMCHGDLAPSPLYSWDGVPLAIGRSGVHTCRDWDAIRDWVTRRNEIYTPLGE